MAYPHSWGVVWSVFRILSGKCKTSHISCRTQFPVYFISATTIKDTHVSVWVWVATQYAKRLFRTHLWRFKCEGNFHLSTTQTHTSSRTHLHTFAHGMCARKSPSDRKRATHGSLFIGVIFGEIYASHILATPRNSWQRRNKKTITNNLYNSHVRAAMIFHHHRRLGSVV